MRSAQLRTVNKKQTVFDSEGRSDLRFGIRHKKGSRGMRCVTLSVPAKTVVRGRSSRLFPGGAYPRVSRRTDRRCAHATFDSGRNRRSDEAGPT